MKRSYYFIIGFFFFLFLFYKGCNWYDPYRIAKGRWGIDVPFRAHVLLHEEDYDFQGQGTARIFFDVSDVSEKWISETLKAKDFRKNDKDSIVFEYVDSVRRNYSKVVINDRRMDADLKLRTAYYYAPDMEHRESVLKIVIYNTENIIMYFFFSSFNFHNYRKRDL